MSIKVLASFASVTLCSFYLFADQSPGPVTQGIQAGKVLVKALDIKGHVLGSCIGFIWDHGTVVSSYDIVKDATMVQVQSGDFRIYLSKVVAFNDRWNLAMLQAEEEMPEGTPLGSSDTLALGDPVYYFNRLGSDWNLEKASVAKYDDVESGFQTIRIQQSPQKKAEGAAISSPLYNTSGKIVGWLFNRTTAIPLKSIYMFLGNKDVTVPLKDINLQKKFWMIHKVPPGAESGQPVRFTKMKSISGTANLPFEIHLPYEWQYRTVSERSRYLLLSLNGEFGISVALRIVKQGTEDLMSAVQQTETMILPNASRSDLVPYSSDWLSGLKACYESADGYTSSILYTSSAGHFYVLTITYPKQFEEDLRPLVEEILKSFKM